ncbi:hypothetical protein PTTG_26565 [Puccinia triticina 1-1 BBBD Race 1]|uniref:NAM-associated domain-containing protein n=1 Tax=Puccinia triticina (isolate 1-1 / race 1 (BBBD)) TaxID=630390 RepID=A0A180GTK8_PUCT1|nr:hypothetical protein PTTG_26565 [Puccinia triticina 1-1 BBBD Race 1]
MIDPMLEDLARSPPPRTPSPEIQPLQPTKGRNGPAKKRTSRPKKSAAGTATATATTATATATATTATATATTATSTAATTATATTATTTGESEKNKNNNTNKEKEKRTKNPNWRVEEDKHLCISWLNTSKDADIGTGQKLSAFWERIHQCFLDMMKEYVEEHANDKNFKPFLTRLQGALESRWGIILHRVNKYCGCFLQAKRRLGSGKTRDEIAVDAKEMFKAEMGFVFTLDHCWLILHHSPKWQDTMDEITVRSKKEKRPPSSISASEPTSVKGGEGDDKGNKHEFESIGSSRPEGRKAAKKRKY